MQETSAVFIWSNALPTRENGVFHLQTITQRRILIILWAWESLIGKLEVTWGTEVTIQWTERNRVELLGQKNKLTILWVSELNISWNQWETTIGNIPENARIHACENRGTIGILGNRKTHDWEIDVSENHNAIALQKMWNGSVQADQNTGKIQIENAWDVDISENAWTIIFRGNGWQTWIDGWSTETGKIHLDNWRGIVSLRKETGTIIRPYIGQKLLTHIDPILRTVTQYIHTMWRNIVSHIIHMTSERWLNTTNTEEEGNFGSS